MKEINKPKRIRDLRLISDKWTKEGKDIIRTQVYNKNKGGGNMNLTKTDKEWITSTIVTSVTQIIKPLEDKVNKLDDKVNKLDDKVEKNHKELTDKVNELDTKVNKLDDKVNKVNDRLSNIVKLNNLKE